MTQKEFKRITQMKKLGLSDELVVNMILQAELQSFFKEAEPTRLNDHLTHAAHLITRYFLETRKEN